MITGDHHYANLMLKLTSNSCAHDNSYADAKRVGGQTYINLYDCTSRLYARWQPEFYESPVFTELLAHELTHQLQILNSAHSLVGSRSEYASAASRYYDNPREVQAWTMGAVTRFLHHSKLRGEDAFWEWAKKNEMYSGWIQNADAKSLVIAHRVVNEVLGAK